MSAVAGDQVPCPPPQVVDRNPGRIVEVPEAQGNDKALLGKVFHLDVENVAKSLRVDGRVPRRPPGRIGRRRVGLIDGESLTAAISDQVLELTAVRARLAGVLRMIAGVQTLGVRHLPMGIAQPEKRSAVRVDEMATVVTHSQEAMPVTWIAALPGQALQATRPPVQPVIGPIRTPRLPVPRADRRGRKSHFPRAVAVPKRRPSDGLTAGPGEDDRHVHLAIRIRIRLAAGQVDLRHLPERPGRRRVSSIALAGTSGTAEKSYRDQRCGGRVA